MFFSKRETTPKYLKVMSSFGSLFALIGCGDVLVLAGLTGGHIDSLKSSLCISEDFPLSAGAP